MHPPTTLISLPFLLLPLLTLPAQSSLLFGDEWTVVTRAQSIVSSEAVAAGLNTTTYPTGSVGPVSLTALPTAPTTATATTTTHTGTSFALPGPWDLTGSPTASPPPPVWRLARRLNPFAAVQSEISSADSAIASAAQNAMQGSGFNTSELAPTHPFSQVLYSQLPDAPTTLTTTGTGIPTTTTATAPATTGMDNCVAGLDGQNCGGLMPLPPSDVSGAPAAPPPVGRLARRSPKKHHYDPPADYERDPPIVGTP